MARQIVDIGASTGIWTRECLRVFPDAQYLLVHPLPANAQALAALQAERANVHVWQGAPGSAGPRGSGWLFTRTRPRDPKSTRETRM